jgi:hypothetical protein
MRISPARQSAILFLAETARAAAEKYGRDSTFSKDTNKANLADRFNASRLATDTSRQ